MGKGSGRREGADDKAFKAAAWPPESPHVRTVAVWRSDCCGAKPSWDSYPEDNQGSGRCDRCRKNVQFHRIDP